MLTIGNRRAVIPSESGSMQALCAERAHRGIGEFAYRLQEN
jgi:hypothetical protein